MTMDISNFYLITPMARPEYIQIKLDDILDKINKEYNLKAKATGGSVYVEVNKGMYGLPQPGFLVNHFLEKRLNKHKYYQSTLVPGLWITLLVDNLGIKYISKEHTQRLSKVLQKILLSHK